METTAYYSVGIVLWNVPFKKLLLFALSRPEQQNASIESNPWQFSSEFRNELVRLLSRCKNIQCAWNINCSQILIAQKSASSLTIAKKICFVRSQEKFEMFWCLVGWWSLDDQPALQHRPLKINQHHPNCASRLLWSAGDETLDFRSLWKQLFSLKDWLHKIFFAEYNLPSSCDSHW